MEQDTLKAALEETNRTALEKTANELLSILWGEEEEARLTRLQDAQLAHRQYFYIETLWKSGDINWPIYKIRSSPPLPSGEILFRSWYTNRHDALNAIKNARTFPKYA